MRPLLWGFGVACVALMVGKAEAQTTLAAPCGLMSQATAAAINGGAVSAGQEQDIPGVAKVCSFAGVGNNGQVEMGETAPTMGGMTTAQMFALAEKTAPSPGTIVTPLSGLGDGAYFAASSMTFDVWVLVGQVMLDVDTTPTQAQAQNPRLEAVMVAAARVALKGM